MREGNVYDSLTRITRRLTELQNPYVREEYVELWRSSRGDTSACAH
jgi:hypothetical protein